jgi:PIN domain nuclease of toxin-antitoxin system
MRLLLDTHAFLWYALNDPQLSSSARGLILDPSNEVLVSPASYWEIAIKIGVGKYALHEPYETFMQRGIFGNGFDILPIELKHTAVLTMLPFHHRDPFDRLLVAQAMVEQVPILGADTVFDAYPVSRLW